MMEWHRKIIFSGLAVGDDIILANILAVLLFYLMDSKSHRSIAVVCQGDFSILPKQL
jgi:hypothetical protein